MVDRVAFTLRTSADRAKAVRLVNGVSAGSRFEVKAPRRSNAQSDLMWTWLTAISEQVEWYGKKYSKEAWKTICTASFRKEVEVVPDIDGTGFVVLGMSTSDLGTQAMSELIDFIMHFAASRGVTLGDE